MLIINVIWIFKINHSLQQPEEPVDSTLSEGHPAHLQFSPQVQTPPVVHVQPALSTFFYSLFYSAFFSVFCY